MSKFILTARRKDGTPVILGTWDKLWNDRSDIWVSNDGEEPINILQRHMPDPWSKSTTEYIDSRGQEYTGFAVEIY